MDSVIKNGKQTGEKIENYSLKSLSTIAGFIEQASTARGNESVKHIGDKLIPGSTMADLAIREAAIVKKAEQRAEAIIVAAQEEAERITAAARAKANEIMSQASEEGFKRGVTLGEEHFKALICSAEQLSDVISGLANPIDDCQLHDIMQFAVAIAAKVVKTELRCNPEVIMSNIKDSLNRCRRMPRVTIKINPDDEVLVSDRLSELRSVYGIDTLIIVSDSNISRGGCSLETEMGNIDATIDTQLREIASELLNDLNTETAEEDSCEN